MPPDDRDTDYDREYEADDGPSANDRTMGMLAHLLTLFTWFVGPAILLVTQADKSPFATRHARESLNFQVAVVLHSMVLLLIGCGGGLVGYLLYDTFHAALIGYMLVVSPLSLAYVIWEIVVIIRAALTANKGLDYRYPLTVRLF